MGDVIYERSTNGGRTWGQVELAPGAPLLVYLRPKPESQPYDDGMGNLYRWRSADG